MVKRDFAKRNEILLKTSKHKEYMSLYLMMIPIVIYYLLFHYGAMYGLLLAFKDFRPIRGILGSEWVGLKHFIVFINDRYFQKVFANTIIISLYRLVLGFPVPIILTLLLNEIVNTKFKRTVQTILYFPRFLSWVIVASFFSTMLSPSTGVVNDILISLGIIDMPQYFMGDKDIFRGLLVGTSIWKEAGWGTIIYLAAITGINPEIYEAAYLDGANRLQKMWHIILPGIMPTVTVMLVLSVGSLLNATGFEQVFTMYNDLVIDKADIIDTYVYRLGIMGGRLSFTTAVGFTKAIVCAILIVISDRSAKALNQDGLF